MNKAQIFDFFSRLAEANPAPVTELEYGNPYQLLVAVTLSAQSTDVGVNKATKRLRLEIVDDDDILEAEIGDEVVRAHHPRAIG